MTETEQVFLEGFTADRITLDTLKWHLKVLEELDTKDDTVLKDIAAIEHIIKYFGG